MYNEYLEFEKPIAELQAKIEELKSSSLSDDINIIDDIEKLKGKCNKLTVSIFKNLTDHQIVQLARHQLRPHSSDYISYIFDDFQPLSGDRQKGKSMAMISGIARIDGKSVMIVCQEKGRETEEKIARNFGMPTPECYRESQRIIDLANKFELPLITFIDTAGAYPGINAEKNNQSGAIAKNIYKLFELETPIVSVIIGEGGSGGALAIGVADKLMMLQYSIFSVISPEGCASILWKDSKKAADAAKQMNLTAEKIYQLGLIDRIITEPVGGAHRNSEQTAKFIKSAIVEELSLLSGKSSEQIIKDRYAKYRAIGAH